MKNGQGGDGCLAFQKISHKKQINKNASKSAMASCFEAFYCNIHIK